MSNEQYLSKRAMRLASMQGEIDEFDFCFRLALAVRLSIAQQTDWAPPDSPSKNRSYQGIDKDLSGAVQPGYRSHHTCSAPSKVELGSLLSSHCRQRSSWSPSGHSRLGKETPAYSRQMLDVLGLDGRVHHNSASRCTRPGLASPKVFQVPVRLGTHRLWPRDGRQRRAGRPKGDRQGATPQVDNDGHLAWVLQGPGNVVYDLPSFMKIDENGHIVIELDDEADHDGTANCSNAFPCAPVLSALTTTQTDKGKAKDKTPSPFEEDEGDILTSNETIDDEQFERMVGRCSRIGRTSKCNGTPGGYRERWPGRGTKPVTRMKRATTVSHQWTHCRASLTNNLPEIPPPSPTHHPTKERVRTSIQKAQEEPVDIGHGRVRESKQKKDQRGLQ
ncbi:hypothetical protein MMC30_005252 [Trapelia coarctata]|nr:hypothetical protein [Trapelia coarctata]